MLPSLVLFSTLIGYLAAGYLAYRAGLAWCRARWARHAYPRVAAPAPSTEWQRRCRGALLGLAVGDAVNLPAESLPRWLVRLRYPGGPAIRRGVIRFVRRPGDISDDTQLAICVARSIAPDGTYRHQRFLHELGLWSYFRIGAGRASAISATVARRGQPRGRDSEGNGVAIRIAPLAIAMAHRSPETLLTAVADNGRATHNSDAAIRGAAFVALLVREAVRLPSGALADPDTMREVLAAASRQADFAVSLPERSALSSEADLRAHLDRIGTSGHVWQSIPAAAVVLLYHRLDIGAAMGTIFRAGGDTDSIGAMVGAVIGAQLGADRLPRVWTDVVQHRDYLCWLADRLAAPRQPSAGAAQIVRLRGDIATRSVDVIVNAWNRNIIPPRLLLPQGVSRALRRAGGVVPIRRVGRRGPLPLGAATETRAGDISCQWVVHVAGIDMLWRASATSVRDAARNALDLSRWLGARSVALPLIGAGSGGLAAAEVETILYREMRRYRHHFDRLELVVYSAG